MKAVLILGAGASRHARGPLMKEFLNQSELISQLLPDRLSSEDHAAFKQVFRAAAQVQQAQAPRIHELGLGRESC